MFDPFVKEIQWSCCSTMKAYSCAVSFTCHTTKTVMEKCLRLRLVTEAVSTFYIQPLVLSV